jgi:hypothetical protein
MKKMPLNVSRNGRMSDSACSPYSDSEMINPARNDPSASDSPNDDVRYADPSPMATTTRVKISWLRNSTIRARSRGTTQRPTISSADVTAMASTMFRTMAAPPLLSPQQWQQEHEWDDAQIPGQDRHRPPCDESSIHARHRHQDDRS